MLRKTALYARGINNLGAALNIKNPTAYDQKNGLDAQIRALRIFCEQNKITDWELFADENQSGTKASRPSLDRMMKAIESGEIENVIVFAFSRYARSVSHMLKGLETMKKYKTNFISLTEKLDLNTSLGHENSSYKLQKLNCTTYMKVCTHEFDSSKNILIKSICSSKGG